jgi:hypothetical protein
MKFHMSKAIMTAIITLDTGRNPSRHMITKIISAGELTIR